MHLVYSERLGYEVVLFNQRSTEPTRAKMFRCIENCLDKIWVFTEVHSARLPWPASLWHV